MATSSTSRRNEEDRRVASHYHERNRTYSSTTTNHYKNKLAQIGIQKDLREILERKKLEKTNTNSEGNHPNVPSQASRKVRFVEDKIPIRRSHSFTSGTFKNHNYNISENTELVKEKSPPKKFNRSFKAKRKDFIDLQNPTNIKIELQTDSGQRKYTVEENVLLGTIKCNMKSCRSILNYSDSKEKNASVQTPALDKGKEKPRQGSSRSGDRNKSFNKKNRGPKEDHNVENDKNPSDGK